jgi:hypothetical protein
MNQLESTAGCQVPRNSVSQQILLLAEEIASLAEDTAVRTDDRLSPVMAQQTPAAPDGSKDDCIQYPPLFDNLRGFLENTRSSLNRINDCICRTEL